MDGEYGRLDDIPHYLADVQSCGSEFSSAVPIVALVIDKEAPMEKVKEVLLELRKANHLKVLFRVRSMG